MKALNTELTKGYLAYLEHFGIALNGKVNQNAMSGQRKSGVKGNSLEFSDFREYIAGDDIRRIDWNSFARGDKLYTKTYFEEKQLNVNLFLDTSKSFGINEEKNFYAKLLCASIAYVALKNNDKVNVYGFNDGLRDIRANNISKNSFKNVVGFLDGLQFEGNSHIVQGINQALPKTQKGISFVISDMFFQDDIESVIKTLRYKKQTIVLLQVLSIEEVNPYLEGSLRLTDCESGDFKDVTINEKILNDYRNTLLNMQNAIGQICKNNGGSFMPITTQVDIKEVVKKIF